MLDKQTGPPCSECGCCESDVIGKILWGDAYIERRVCSHCNSTFFSAVESEGEVVAIFQHTLCPYCNSRSTCCYKTSQNGSGKRWHKCRACRRRFTSVEL